MNDTNENNLKKVGHILLKILMYIGIAIGVVILIAAAYQILKYLFVGAILLAAWLFPCSRRR